MFYLMMAVSLMQCHLKYGGQCQVTCGGQVDPINLDRRSYRDVLFNVVGEFVGGDGDGGKAGGPHRLGQVALIW